MTNKIEVCIQETIKIFFSSKAAYKIFRIFSIDKSLNKQYNDFIDILFSCSFIGKGVLTPHHLNSIIWFFNGSVGIERNGSRGFLFYFLTKFLENIFSLSTRSIAKNFIFLSCISYFVGEKYSYPFPGDENEINAR